MTMLNESLQELAANLSAYKESGAVLEAEAVTTIVHMLNVAAEQARMLEVSQQQVTAEHLYPGSNVVLWPIARRSIPPRERCGGAA